MDVIKVGVLTISDRCAGEGATDESGPALVRMVKAGIVKNGEVVRTHLVPDCKEDIEMVLRRWCDDNLHLILTTGGTGLSERDVTPEATAAVLERTVPGIPLLMFKHSSIVTPLAALSRATAGVRGSSLIINLPGSRKACRECLEAVASVIPHAVDVINGRKAEVETVHTGLKKKSSVRADRPADRNRMSPYPCISVTEAQGFVMNTMFMLRKEIIVGYEQALHHVLAENIIVEDNHPPFDASLKDGYAVLSSDGRETRSLIGVCHAGEWPCDVRVVRGTCMRVSTGGAIPPGADAVVAVENTQLESLNDESTEERQISFLITPEQGAEIRKKGSDFAVGEKLMDSGTQLDSVGVGLLAALGIVSVRVYGKPVVAVMSTGNELSSPDEPLKPGKVRDSNRITLISMLKEENYETVDLGIIPDEPDSLRDSLEKGFRAADVVVTTGSMSMGERDLLKEVIVADFDGEILYGRVLLKPGMPTAFGLLDFEGMPKVWFGLPGNPASTFVCSQLFLLPGLRKLSGYNEVFPKKLRDFLLQYNKISESCFLNCVNHLSDRPLSQDECGCVDMCTKKHVSVNHKVMQVYMEIQPLLIKRRIEEMNKQQTAVEEAHKKELEDSQKTGIPDVEKAKMEGVGETKKFVNIAPGSDLPDKEIVRTEYQ